MKHPKIDPNKIFLSERTGKEMLKDMILMKSERLDILEKNREIFLKSDAYPDVKERIRPYFLEKVAELKFGQEMAEIERDLRNMCFILNKSENKIPQTTEWEKMYQKATEDTRIEDVASHFLGTREFRRNLKCPFHEDKSPSFKIYTNKNCFVCFGCGVRGSPIDFVMKYKNYDFKEAVEFIYQLTL